MEIEKILKWIGLVIAIVLILESFEKKKQK